MNIRSPPISLSVHSNSFGMFFRRIARVNGKLNIKSHFSTVRSAVGRIKFLSGAGARNRGSTPRD